MVHGEYIVCCTRESSTTTSLVVGCGGRLFLLRFSVHSIVHLANAVTEFFYQSRLANDVMDVFSYFRQSRVGNVMTEDFHIFINSAWQILWLRFSLRLSISSGRCCDRHFMHSSI
jgi:hypothetical protein